MSRRTLEWRMVDDAGAPFDTGEGMWPIYDKEQDAVDQLDLYASDDPDLGLHLEVREVQSWKPYTPAASEEQS